MFCQILYSIQLITAELNPGITPIATRVGSYVYPKSLTPNPDDVRLVNIGQYQCTDTTRQFHGLVLQLSFRGSRNFNFADKVGALRTYPKPTINILANDIRAEIASGTVPRDRRRVVVILTDGVSDNTQSDIRGAVADLVSISDTLTVIAAGIANPINFEESDLPQFRIDLKTLANGNEDNFLVARGPKELSIGLVEKMRLNGAICEDRGMYYERKPIILLLVVSLLFYDYVHLLNCYLYS